MANRYFLVIDAGTGSGRAVLFDIEGKQISVGQEEWNHLSETNVPASMGFDFATNWPLICRCIRKALNDAQIQPEEVVAVSASSMREGIVLYDKKGRELWGVANVDGRASAEVEELKARFPELEKDFYAESGQTYALGALPRLLWVKKNRPEIYEQTEKLSMISDWVLAKLSGEISSDPSNAGTAGIFSLQNRTWQSWMAQKVEVKCCIYPECVESGTVIGEVNSKAADETGLKAGTPVVMGGGDVQLGCAGLGVVENGQSAILGGTFWQQLVNMDKPLSDPKMRLRVNPHVIPGISQAEGITFFVGLVMRWFRDAICHEERVKAAKQGIDPYTYLEGLAKDVPVGSHGIIPIFSDAMNYGKWYHAAPSFLNMGLDPEIYSKGAMFRALQENAAIVTQVNLERIREFTGVDSEELIFAAGASKGNLWCQILADVTGKRIKVPMVKEATSLGGAFACGVGTGDYTSIADAAKNLVKWDKTYEPDRENHKIYQGIKEQWQEVYAEQLKLVDRRLTTSMWKAPGV